MALASAGFNFDNCLRNTYLISKGFPAPKPLKTGTTIVGIIFKDGVILGADTRATEDTIVADKNCSKIHYLANNMYCCGAGTAGDTEMITKLVAANLELHRLSTDCMVPVVVAKQMLKQYLYRHLGNLGAALILGGIDLGGPSLYSIYSRGSVHQSPYEAMGSGSLAAIAVLENGWKEDLNLEDGKQLIHDAICGGIFNDLGSGSNVDMCIITREGVDYIRPYDEPNVKAQKFGNYRYEHNTTSVLYTVTHTVVTAPDEEMDFNNV